MVPRPGTSSQADIVDVLTDSARLLTFLVEMLLSRVSFLEEQDARKQAIIDSFAPRIESLETDLDKIWLFRPADRWPYVKQALPDRHGEPNHTTGITAILPEFKQDSGDV